MPDLGRGAPFPPHLTGEALCGVLVRAELADPKWWTPEPPVVEQIGRAVKICERCNIREECFDHALRTPSIQGVYGAFPFRVRGLGRGRPQPTDS